MPRFLHTSDLHINALRRYSGYLERMRKTLFRILEIGEEKNVTGIVVAGDLFDRLDVTHTERRLLSEWLMSSRLPILAISGNHDKRTDEVGDTCINYLSLLSPRLPHVIYDGPPTCLDLWGCRFILIPYQGWMDQEVYLIVSALCQSSRAVTKAGIPLVVVMHEAVSGCVNDAGRTITKNHQIRLDGTLEQVTYWALGDMHHRQAILPNAWYCGAPQQTKFDDNPDKGVLIVDTDRPTEPEFVPVETTQLVILRSEPLGGWPGQEEALVQYIPQYTTVAQPSFPENVKLHPASMLATISSSKASSFQVLDGLDPALLSAGLQQDLVPMAWRLAIKMLQELGIEETLPEQYKV